MANEPLEGSTLERKSHIIDKQKAFNEDESIINSQFFSSLLGASGVKFSGGTDRDLLTIQEAVEIAGLLRREEHVAQNQY